MARDSDLNFYLKTKTNLLAKRAAEDAQVCTISNPGTQKGNPGTPAEVLKVLLSDVNKGNVHKSWGVRPRGNLDAATGASVLLPGKRWAWVLREQT